MSQATWFQVERKLKQTELERDKYEAESDRKEIFIGNLGKRLAANMKIIKILLHANKSVKLYTDPSVL